LFRKSSPFWLENPVSLYLFFNLRNFLTLSSGFLKEGKKQDVKKQTRHPFGLSQPAGAGFLFF